MSIAQVHLKGKDKYKLHDDVVVHFCFPTLGVAVPLHPGDFWLFNKLVGAAPWKQYGIIVHIIVSR